jgi:protein SCO1
LVLLKKANLIAVVWRGREKLHYLNPIPLHEICERWIGMRLVSLSFDPDYDTSQRLGAYSEAMRDEKSGCEWRFAAAKSRVELDSILNGYGQAVDKRSNPNDPQGPLYHILRVFLVDREGRIRNIYSSATLDARLVLADVKTLLVEETNLSKH